MVVFRLYVNADEVGSRLGKSIDKLMRGFHHEMYVEKDLRAAAQVGHGLGTEGDVGDEVTIHHVDVYPSASIAFNFGEGAGEISVVTGKDGRGENPWAWFAEESVGHAAHQVIRFTVAAISRARAREATIMG